MRLRSRLDRAFARYARTGEPGALAVVFDGSAAELYRLGFHLLGDRHAAEDLVQQTFVVAIEQAKSFDGGRRVLPWLCGILTNRALHLRRQRRQRAAAAPAGRDVAVDPLAEANAREAGELVARTVRALPEPYRQVLLLHLLHELPPKDIAEALSRPDATVRTQLARGLDMLRKALPAGLASLGACSVLPATGLAALREAVLGHAAGVGRAAASSTAVGVGTGGIVFTGVLAMKKVLLAVVVLAAMVGSWLWWSGEPGLPPDAGATSRRVASAAAQTVPQAGTPSTTSNGAGRAVALPPQDPNTASLELVVLWHDGTPAADIPVRVRPRPLDFEAWLHTERTGGDGIVRFIGLPPGPANALTGRGAQLDVELTAGSAQRATITIANSLDVAGRVVDLDGRPFAGATVWLSVAPMSDDGEAVATSAADGTFTVRGVGVDHIITATAPGFAAKEVRVLPASTEVVLSMRAAPGVVCGLVTDAEDRPVHGARILIGMIWGARDGVHERLGEVRGEDLWPARFLRTDFEGRFRCEGLPAWRWPLWVGAPDHAAHRCDVDLTTNKAAELTIRLVRGAVVRGCVRDASGAPVANAEMHVHGDTQVADRRVNLGVMPALPPLWANRFAYTDANGLYEIRHVEPGRNRMTASGPGGSTHEECDLVDRQVRVWDAVLRSAPGEALHGVLVDEDGQPLEHWTVRVDRDEEPHRGNRIRVGEGGQFRTNRVPPGRHRLIVQPDSPMIGADVDAGEFDVATCPLRIVVPRSGMPRAHVRGRIVPADTKDAAHWDAMLVPRPPLQFVQVSCDEHGDYVVGPVQKGQYRLWAMGPKFASFVIGDVEVEAGDVELGAFEVPRMGTLAVRVVDAAGEQVPDAWVSVKPVGDDRRGGGLDHRDGTARGELPVGRWRVESTKHTTLAAMEVEVRAGETTDVRLGIPDGVPFVLRTPKADRDRIELTLRWRDASGALLRDCRWWVEPDGHDDPHSAPAGRYVLEVVDRGTGCTTSSVLDLRAAEPPMVVELPLPTR